MFDRYTLSARRVIFFARYAVTQIGGREIDSDFLLWGLARETPELLDELGATGVQEAIATARESPEKAPPTSDLPLSRDAKAALMKAAEEARRLGSKDVRVVHLLLGLLADHQSPAGARLSKLGIVAEQVRALAHEERIQALDDRPARDDFPGLP